MPVLLYIFTIYFPFLPIGSALKEVLRTVQRTTTQIHCESSPRTGLIRNVIRGSGYIVGSHIVVTGKEYMRKTTFLVISIGLITRKFSKCLDDYFNRDNPVKHILGIWTVPFISSGYMNLENISRIRLHCSGILDSERWLNKIKVTTPLIR